VRRVELLTTRKLRRRDSIVAAQGIGPPEAFRPTEAFSSVLTGTDVANEVVLNIGDPVAVSTTQRR
jgi:hypothetical protein